MGANTEAWYEEQFISGVRQSFQHEGWMLRDKSMAPVKITGDKAHWKKMGTSAARPYTPGNTVTPSNIDKSSVSADMAAYDDADYVYAVDLNRTTAQERDLVSRQIGYSLGRKFDQLHFDAMNAETLTQVGAVTAAFDPAVALAGVQQLTKATKNWPGRIWCAMPSNAFYQMKTYDAVSNSDWSGADLPLKTGTPAFMWSGVHWFLYGDDDAFPLASGDDRTFWMWHEAAIGRAYADELSVAVDWVAEKRGWLHQAWMDMAVKVIRPEGMIEFLCDDDATFTVT